MAKIAHRGRPVQFIPPADMRDWLDREAQGRMLTVSDVVREMIRERMDSPRQRKRKSPRPVAA